MNYLAIRGLILAALTVGTGVLCQTTKKPLMGIESGVAMDLPVTIPGMISENRTHSPDPAEKAMLPSDTEFSKAVYFTPGADASTRDVVHFEIVLSGAERRSIHRPEVCLQGQGWTLLKSGTRRIAIRDRELEVSDLYISREETTKDGGRRTRRAHFFYWFVGNDVTTPGHVGRLWLTLRDNILHGVNHRWAYASVLALVTEDQPASETGERQRSSEETAAMLEKFIASIAPHFQKSFMDNTPVAAAN